MKNILLILLSLYCLAGMAQTQEPLKAGMAAPDFSYQDVNGKVLNLKDLRDKYVYIDIWATWCTPCRGELPFLQKLKQKMSGKNIVFVCISCDKDVEAWKKMVKEYELTGIQLNTGGDKNFMKAFGVRGIPRFILLDPDGKIIHAEMTRPSQEETLESLMELEGI